MKDITILIPLHSNEEKYNAMLQNAIANIYSMEEKYEGKIKTRIIFPKGMEIPQLDGKDGSDISFLYNPGDTDFCSQVNFGASLVDTEYFTIMEVDDRYSTKWFNMFNNYIDPSENISVYMPINVVHNLKTNGYEFVNQIAWSTSFTANDENIDVADMDRIGYITFNSLQDNASFNLTGSIFKTSDWLSYKASIKVAFNYEYLLRATNKKQRIFVVPKEGYYHDIFRDGSLTDIYTKEIDDKDVAKWFELAKREYAFDEDRNNGILVDKEEQLK